jgi:CRP-like cAMP-binding protein
VREGDCPTRSFVILSGFTCTYKVSQDGKRQIMTFDIAGDMPDLQSLHLRMLDSSISSFSPCRVGFITHEDLRDLCDRYPRITGHFSIRRFEVKRFQALHLPDV